MTMNLIGVIEADVVPSKDKKGWWVLTGENVKYGDLTMDSYIEDAKVKTKKIQIEGITNCDYAEDDPRLNGYNDEPSIGIMTREDGTKVALIEVNALEAGIFRLICPSS